MHLPLAAGQFGPDDSPHRPWAADNHILYQSNRISNIHLAHHRQDTTEPCTVKLRSDEAYIILRHSAGEGSWVECGTIDVADWSLSDVSLSADAGDTGAES